MPHQKLNYVHTIKIAIKDHVKNKGEFPTELWQKIKADHPEALLIDQSVISEVIRASVEAGDLHHGLTIMCELAQLKKGQKHITEDIKLAGYNALLSHCERRLHADVKVGDDASKAMDVVDKVNAAGLAGKLACAALKRRLQRRALARRARTCRT